MAESKIEYNLDLLQKKLKAGELRLIDKKEAKSKVWKHVGSLYNGDK